MATNRDIIFTVKVRNQLKGALKQIADDFRKQAKDVDTATKALTNYKKALDSVAKTSKGLTTQSKALGEIAKQSGNINDRKITNMANALTKLSGSSSNIAKAATNLQNLNRSFGQTRGITGFATQLAAAQTQAQSLLQTLQQVVNLSQQLGRTKTLNLRVNTTQTIQPTGAPTAAPVVAPAGIAPNTPNAPPVGVPVPAISPQTTAKLKGLQGQLQQTSASAVKFQRAMTEAAAAAALVSGPLGGIASRLTAIDTLFGNLGVGSGLLVSGLLTLGAALTFAASAGLEFEQQQAKIGAIIKATGNTANQTLESVNEAVSAISRTTTISGTEVRNAATQLLTFKSVGEDVFDRILNLAADSATAGFGNIEQNVIRLGKAMEDPISGIESLRDSGITFTASQRLMIEALVRNNQQLDAQKLILKEVESQVGGTAKAAGQGLAGALNVLSSAAKSFFVELANDTGLLDGLNTIVRDLAAGIDFLKDNLESILPTLKAFSAILITVGAAKTARVGVLFLAASFNTLVGPIVKATTALKNYNTAVQVSNATGLATSAVLNNIANGAALTGIGPTLTKTGAAAVGASQNLSLFSRVLLAIGDFFRSTGGALGGFLTRIPILGTAFAILGKTIGLVLVPLRALFALIALNPFVAFAGFVLTAIGTLVLFKDKIVTVFGETFRVIDLAEILWRDFSETVTSVLTTISDKIGSFLDPVLKYVTDGVRYIAKLFFDGFSLILGYVKEFVNRFIGYYVGLAYAVAEVINQISEKWDEFFNNLARKAVAAGDVLSNFFTGNFEEAAASLDEVLNSQIIPDLTDSLTKVREEFLRGWNTDFVGIVGDNFKSAIDGMLDYFSSSLEEASDRTRAKATAEVEDMFDRRGNDPRRNTNIASGEPVLAASLREKMVAFNEEMARSLEELRTGILLQNQFGREGEKSAKLLAIAIKAYNAGLLQADATLPQVIKQLEDMKKLMEEIEDLDFGKNFRDMTPVIRGLKAAVTEFTDEALNLFENVKDLATGFIDDLTDRWVEFTQTGAFNWKEMLDQMAADVQRFAFRYSLAKIAEASGLTQADAEGNSIASILGLVPKVKQDGAEPNALSRYLLDQSQVTPMGVHIKASDVAIAPASVETIVKSPLAPSQQPAPSSAQVPPQTKNFFTQLGDAADRIKEIFTSPTTARVETAPIPAPAPVVTLPEVDISGLTGPLASLGSAYEAARPQVESFSNSLSKDMTSIFNTGRQQLTEIGSTISTTASDIFSTAKTRAADMVRTFSGLEKSTEQVTSTFGDFRDNLVKGLSQRGFSEPQIEGILAAARSDSGPALNNARGPVQPNGTQATGFFQWLGPRLKDLDATAKAAGKSIYDAGVQTEFFFKEVDGLVGTEKRYYDQLKANTKTSQEAAEFTVNKILRPGADAPKNMDRLQSILPEYQQKIEGTIGDLNAQVSSLGNIIKSSTPTAVPQGSTLTSVVENGQLIQKVVQDTATSVTQPLGSYFDDLGGKVNDLTSALKGSSSSDTLIGKGGPLSVAQQAQQAGVPLPPPLPDSSYFGDITELTESFKKGITPAISGLTDVSETIRNSVEQTTTVFKALPAAAEKSVASAGQSIQSAGSYFDDLAQPFTSVREAINQSAGTVSQTITDQFNGLTTAFKAVPEAAAQASTVINAQWGDAVSAFGSGLTDGAQTASQQIKPVLAGIGDSFSALPLAAEQGVQEAASTVQSVGSYFQDLSQPFISLQDTISQSAGTVSQTVTDGFNNITTAFRAVPEAAAQASTTINAQWAPAAEVFGTGLQTSAQAAVEQIKPVIAGVGTSFDSLPVVAEQAQSQLQTSFAEGIGSVNFQEPFQQASQNLAANLQYTAAAFGEGVSAQVQTAAETVGPQLQGGLLSFTEQFAGDTQSMLGPIQSSVQQVASGIQTSADQIAASGQYTAQAFQQVGSTTGSSLTGLAASAQQAGSSMVSAGSQASAASGGVSTLGAASTSSASQVQQLGSSAGAAGTQIKSAGGTSAGGFGGLFQSILGSIGGMLKGITGQIFGVVQSLFSSLMGVINSLGSGGFGGGLGSILGSLFHEGGVVGQTVPQAVQLVAKSRVMSAPRYHKGTGLRPDERVAVLQTGEIVLSRDDVKSIRNSRNYNGGFEDMMRDTSQMSPSNSRAAQPMPVDRGGQRQVVVKQYITTPDPEAFNASQSQIARNTFSAMDRLNRRNS